MARASSNGLNHAALKRFATAIHRLDSVDDINAFLMEVLTPAELRDITLRWQLMELLAHGVPQRQIARQLKISLCKITRGSRIRKQKDALSVRLMNMDDATEET